MDRQDVHDFCPLFILSILPIHVNQGIALLLLDRLHHLSKAAWSLSVLASMLRLNLFTYRDLRDWFDDLMNTPPWVPLPIQLELALGELGQANPT